jgi:addiction module HigA family antidote
MHNPSHPGKVLKEWMPADLTVTNAAKQLKVSRPVFSKILNGRSGISVNMALRLSAWLDTSPDLWLGMQRQWDLCQAKKNRILKIKRLVVNGKKA